MSDRKTIFLAFAKDDAATRNFFTADRIGASTAFEFTDLSPAEAVEADWTETARTRIRRCAGVIALLSTNTPHSSRQRWEISCAVAEGVPLIGVWIQTRYRGRPAELGTAPCREWTWENVGAFIDSAGR